MSIKVFTKKDYIKSLELYPELRKRKSRLEDEEVEYNIDNKHDKIFKTILLREEEAEYVIKKALKLKKDKKLDLISVENEYITVDYRGKRVDVIYKLKDKEIYFIIEHQSTQDKNMPYRILEYEVEVMRASFIKNNYLSKAYARVIAIVIYTGKGKWKPNQSIEEVQEKLESDRKKEKDYTGIGEYNLIDINEYGKEELLKENNLISKIMLIEKAGGEQELIEILDKIIPKVKENEKGEMVRIIKYILVKDLGKEKAKKYIKKLEGDGDMLAVIQTLKEDRKRNLRNARMAGLKEGNEKGKLEEAKRLAVKLLKKNMSVEEVAELTELDKEEIIKQKDIINNK